ncbi:uncharacterized protein CIMG_13612 [Coccidioides immitis RS]|uniref:Uncharacterized protein n=1 Tax=Coccidioides immitis (strain RS) TaxID=246410 RepID=J3K2G0_COCIM|nr:uncharacterized protein CIMG_13612 [Coccidioides immitis RS]EAS28270.3 hypothetical protein CIMG_13612 [Coccidioides immitis RS]
MPYDLGISTGLKTMPYDLGISTGLKTVDVELLFRKLKDMYNGKKEIGLYSSFSAGLKTAIRGGREHTLYLGPESSEFGAYPFSRNSCFEKERKENEKEKIKISRG